MRESAESPRVSAPRRPPALARPAALALMVIAPVLWSTAGVVTRHMEAARPLELAFWRSLFCALCVATVLLAIHRHRAPAVLRAVGLPGLLSGGMWAIMFTCFIIALRFTSTANVLVVCSLGPLCTALLARLVLREPIPARTWIAILVAAAGMTAMFASGFAATGLRDLAGMLLALTVPLAAAVNVVTLRKAAASVDLVPAVFIGAACSALFTLPWALPVEATSRDLLLLAFLGVFQVGLPCMLLVLASRTLPAPEIALLGLLEVVLGTLWAWLGAAETPALATLAGGTLVLVALAGNAFLGWRRTRPA